MKTHHAVGLGTYCYFRDAENVWLQSAIETPRGTHNLFEHMINFWLEGKDNTGILHVINDVGEPVTRQHRQTNVEKWPVG